MASRSMSRNTLDSLVLSRQRSLLNHMDGSSTVLRQMVLLNTILGQMVLLNTILGHMVLLSNTILW